jgi:hypothetical protein
MKKSKKKLLKINNLKIFLFCLNLLLGNGIGLHKGRQQRETRRGTSENEYQGGLKERNYHYL